MPPKHLTIGQAGLTALLVTKNKKQNNKVMKKTIFISVLALAAAISCTKSDIVDTKFEKEAIGFENYLGRDAQTKGPEATLETLKEGEIGIFGAYTGAANWDGKTEAKLLINERLYWGRAEGASADSWIYDNTAYWTNNQDKYSFLAYSPYSEEAATQPEGKSPQVTFEVNDAIADQIDFVYANTVADKDGANGHVNMVRPASNAPVSLKFKHALTRLSVKAKAAADYTDFTFNITNISITGTFNTSGTFDLYNGTWISKTETANKSYNLTGSVNQALTTAGHDFSAEDNYLMMIPTDFSSSKATLNVTYTITYKGATSNPIPVSVDVTKDFLQGNAYLIILELKRDDKNAIKFTVDEEITGWDNGGDVNVSTNA